jgi:hypothetical protein
VTFSGNQQIGGSAVLEYADRAGRFGAVFLATGLLAQPVPTPYGGVWLTGAIVPLWSGTMPADRIAIPLPIPAEPALVAVAFHAQGFSDAGGLSQPARVVVVDRNTDPAKSLRVLVLNFDPVLESRGGRRLHEVAGWGDPRQLTNAYVDSLRRSSGGFVDQRVVEFQDLDVWPVKMDGFRYTDESYLLNLGRGSGWHQPDGVDYDAIIRDHGLVARVNAGDVDEVIVWGGPYFGYYESRMAGPNAYWCNSPGMPWVPTTRKFVMMGLNYERGEAEALHSHGHRTESILVRVYGSWNGSGPPQHHWDRFTRYDRIDPGNAACGNVHFPPNGTADYDYGNFTLVFSTADDWKASWPALTGARGLVNASAWGGTHLGYLRWWFDHLPRRVGVNPDGKQNNWWKYVTLALDPP